MKVSYEQAEKEVTAWLDKKKVFEETRDRFKDQIAVLTEAITNGALIYNQDTFEFTHVLLFPMGEDGPEQVKEIKYKARINDKMVQPYKKGVASNDFDGQVNALIAALTTQSRGFIEKLDTADKKIANAIGIFFM